MLVRDHWTVTNRLGLSSITHHGIAREEMEALEVDQSVREWAVQPNSSYPTWPIADVSVPGKIKDGWYELTLVCGDTLLCVYTIYKGCELHSEFRAFKRKAAEDYWPSAAECQARVERWADMLQADMLSYLGQDCDAGGPNITPDEHWLRAKRRYQLKGNQTCRLAFLTQVDPEGRHRCNMTCPLPDHVERWLRYADFLVGVRSGVSPADMDPGDLYASGGAIEEGALLSWCRAIHTSSSV